MLFRFRCSIIKTLKKDNIRDGVYRGGLAGWVHHKHFGRFLHICGDLLYYKYFPIWYLRKEIVSGFI